MFGVELPGPAGLPFLGHRLRGRQEERGKGPRFLHKHMALRTELGTWFLKAVSGPLSPVPGVDPQCEEGIHCMQGSYPLLIGVCEKLTG